MAEQLQKNSNKKAEIKKLLIDSPQPGHILGAGGSGGCVCSPWKTQAGLHGKAEPPRAEQPQLNVTRGRSVPLQTRGWVRVEGLSQSAESQQTLRWLQPAEQQQDDPTVKDP